jgi:hypothetical protein
MKTRFRSGTRWLMCRGATSDTSDRPARGRRKTLRHSALFGMLWLTSLVIMSTLPSCNSAQENTPSKAASASEPESGAAQLGNAIPPPRQPTIVETYGREDELSTDLDGGKIGFIDRSGRLVVKPVFYGAGDFAANGLAPVGVDPAKNDAQWPTGWGYINAKGDLVVRAQFKLASDFGDTGLALAERDDGTMDFIDATGRFETSNHFQLLRADRGMHGAYRAVAFFHLLAAAKLNGKWGYIGTQGQWIISARFEDAHDFSASGLAAIKQRGKWGYIDLKGKVVIAPQFDYAGYFAQNGLACASLSPYDQYGYINQQGKMVIAPRFEECRDFGYKAPGSLAWVIVGGGEAPLKEGLIDAKGQFVVQPSTNGDGDIRRSVSTNGLRSYREESLLGLGK